MTKTIKKCFTLLILVLTPLAGYTSEPVHKAPILTTTAIIEVHEGGEFKGIVLIERGKAPFGKAIPGGKVEYGETVEQAVRREMMEEVGLPLSDLKQFHVYSDPSRDSRHHSVEVAHIAKAYQSPTAGDDAASAFVVQLQDIPWIELAFDHAQVLRDYVDWRKGNEKLGMSKIADSYVPMQALELSTQDYMSHYPRIIEELKKIYPELSPADLKLISMRAVTWNDGSLGCSEPGMCYTMALVPGFLILYQYFDHTIEVHTDQSLRRICVKRTAN